MLSTLFYLLLLATILLEIFGGRINGPSEDILELYSNNALEYGHYTFRYITESDTQEGDYLYISFPLGQYDTILDTIFNLDETCVAELAPDYFSDVPRSLNCQYVKANKRFEIEYVETSGGEENIHELTIYGLQNPSAVGVTGFFRIETRRGAFNILDYGDIYRFIGIRATPTNFTGVTAICSANQEVNLNATYDLQFTSAEDIPAEGKIAIIFPVTMYVQDDFVVTPSTNAGTVTKLNDFSFELTDFDNDVPTGVITVQVTQIKNRGFAGSPGDIIIQSWTDAVNTMIQQSIVAVPALNPGPISTVSTDFNYTNFGYSGLSLIRDDFTQYQFYFTTVNEVPEGGKIIFTFPVAPTFCQPGAGFNDLDENTLVSCSIVGNSIEVVDFFPIPAGGSASIILRATNPSAGGATVVLELETYNDVAETELVDELPATESLSIDATLTLMDSLSITLSSDVAGDAATWEFIFQNPTTLNAGNLGTISLTISSAFDFDGTPVCALYPDNGGAHAPAPTCTLTGGVLSFTTGTATLNTGTDQRFTVATSGTGIINPEAGDYVIIFSISEAGTPTRQETIIVTTTPAAIPGLAIQPLTRDQNRYTMYKFTFTAPDDISAGNWQSDANNVQSFIVVEFPTQTGGGVDLFDEDLGKTTVADGDTIPCYGGDALERYDGGSLLSCQLNKAAAASPTDFVQLVIYDFAAITSGSNVILYIPNIKNSDSLTDTADITLKIRKKANHLTKIIFTETVTVAVATVNMVVKNPKNDDGASGIPTNLAPAFAPASINEVSKTEILLTPGPSRGLAAGATSAMLLKFPSLPTTDPMHYVFSSETYCTVSAANTPQPCLVFPEVGWIVFETLAAAFPQQTEGNIKLFEIQNPPYVGALQGQLQIFTIVNNVEYGDVLYLSFDSFTSGTFTNINIFPDTYQANAVDVTYNWIFVTENPIPAGGYLELTFPPNIYNLESTPPCIGIISQGLSDLSEGATIEFDFTINVVTITNIDEVPGGTLIRVIITGVKNPVEETSTSSFAITSYNQEGKVIDTINTIPGITIIRAQTVGLVTFNYFYTTPSNGLLLADYYLSFYPKTTYPKGTLIEILFPTTEFAPAVFLGGDCAISGALTTLESCNLNSGASKYEATTDTKLEIEPGMEPLMFFFPKIVNFNEELSSGVVTVRATYDGVTLDTSGTGEEGRKAETSSISTLLSISGFGFSPTTEGALSTYTVTLEPDDSFDSDAVIQFRFPDAFARGLGAGVNCFMDKIKIPDVPVRCAVDGRILNITSHAGFDLADDEDIEVRIENILNPNKEPLVTDEIIVYILTTETFAKWYNLNLGALVFTDPPANLDMVALSSSNQLTRQTADYSITLRPTVDLAANSVVFFFFSLQMNLEEFSPTPRINFNGGGFESTTATYTTIIYTAPSLISAGTEFTVDFQGLANPFDDITDYYPIVGTISAGEQVMTTADNLIKPEELTYQHNGDLIVINNDEDAIIYPGHSNNYIIEFPDPTTEILEITGSSRNPSISVSHVIVPIGSTTSSIWIGVSENAIDQDSYVEFTVTPQGDYWIIRPLLISIIPGTAEIFVSEIVSVPAGGRSNPTYITLLNSPKSDLTISLYQRGTVPTEINIYPSKLTFYRGELSKPFWVSSGKNAQGTEGSVLFVMSGQNQDAFYLPNRIKTFLLSTSDTQTPYIFDHNQTAVQGNGVTMYFKASEPITIYYMILPTGSPAPIFNDIKEKRIGYDYYGADYIVGEYVNVSSTFEYTFTITGLTPLLTYDAYFYGEDYNGNLVQETIEYQFTTPGHYPLLVSWAFDSSPAVEDLIEAIIKILGFPENRFETDLSVLEDRGGSTTKLSTDLASANVREKFEQTETAASGANFLIMPDYSDHFAHSNEFIFNMIYEYKLEINEEMGGDLDVSDGVPSYVKTEPDDIKWASGSSRTDTPSYTQITISGLQLSAPGLIHGVAYKGPRSKYPTTQEGLTEAIRKLQEEEEEDGEGGVVEGEEAGEEIEELPQIQECYTDWNNELTVHCYGDHMGPVDETRGDAVESYIPTTPSSYAVSKECDSHYFKGDAVAQAENDGETTSSLVFRGLEENTTYTIYITATDGYAKYPVHMIDDYLIKVEVQTLSSVVETEFGTMMTGVALSTLMAILGMALLF